MLLLPDLQAMRMRAPGARIHAPEHVLLSERWLTEGHWGVVCALICC